MANPTWFNEQEYLASKLKQLQADGNTAYPDTAAVKTAIEAAGFTLFDHFTTYGAAERTSPNSLFNATEYLEAKVKALNAPGSTTVWTVDSVAAAFVTAGVSPWEHYQQWGAAEGLNPSNAFDTSSYYEAKVAKLNSTQTEKVWTVDEVKAAFAEAGLSPVSHYLSVGTAEGLTVTPVPTAEQVTPDARDVGKTFTLTTEVDTIIGTDKNDIGTGTSATLRAGDTIIDQSSTDKDVLNLTLTTANEAARISKIENINVNWDAFGDAEFVATNVTGATVTLSSTKVGYLGNATVTGAGANSVVAGSGMKGNLTVNGVTAATINAGTAKTVTADGTVATTDSVKVTAGATTTEITTNASIETATVTTGAATTKVTTNSIATSIDASAAAKDVAIAVNGTAGDTDEATIKVGNDAGVTVTGFTGTEKLVLDVAAGKTVTLVTPTTVEVKGSGDVTLKAAFGDLTGDTITKSNTGKLNVELTGDVSAFNSTKIAADSVKLTAQAGVAALTVKSGQSFEVVAKDATSAVTVNTSTAGTADTATVKLTSAAYANVESTVVAGPPALDDIETLTIQAAAAAKTGADLTIGTIVNAGNTVVLTGTNDVAITTSVNTKILDASALTGELTVAGTAVAATDITIAGAQGKNNVTFNAAAVKAAFVGQAADDKVGFGTLGAAAVATAVTGAGKDEITANVSTLTTGALSVDAGAGDDIVNLNGAAVGTEGTIVLQFGEGTDTLKLGAAADLTKANLTITGLEKLVVNGSATFNANQISGKSLVVDGTTAAAADDLIVLGTASTGETIDLSGLTLTDSVTTGMQGTSITGLGGADVILGTSRADIIDGGAGNDTINGGAGNDTITGGAGSDSITLGAGSDILVFNSLVGSDTVADYVVADDSIQLSKAVFTALGAVGALTAAEFESGAGLVAATTADARIVYDTTAGNLYYDADGVGGAAVALIGTFTGAQALVVGEFSIIA